MDTNELRKLASAATPGPWQVIEQETPHYLGGKHVERRIFTTWVHPQMKGFDWVVNHSVGIGKEQGGPVHHQAEIRAEDAAYIAAASPDVVLALLDELDRMRLLLTDQEAAYTAGLMEGARQCREMATKGWGTAPLNAAAAAIEQRSVTEPTGEQK